jgi:hypothetical protein
MISDIGFYKIVKLWLVYSVKKVCEWFYKSSVNIDLLITDTNPPLD